MIDLVLEARREQSRRIQLEGTSFAIERPHAHAASAGDRLEDAGYGQTALLHDLFAFGLHDYRVDEYLQLVSLLGEIDDHHPFRYPNLNRRETNARRAVHRLDHVGDQRAY